MTNRSRIAAAVLAAITILVVLSSSIFIIEHADHNCTGEDCPICEQLCACAQNLKNLTTVAVTVMVIIAFRFALQAVIGQAKYAYVPYTPVYLKVKLSN